MKGWQFLDEDYFAAQIPTNYGTGAIWGAIVLIYNPAPVKPPSYNFANDLKLGASGPDVTALQQFLAYDGVFNLAPTGYYGQITAQAVLAFQLKYLLSSATTLEELGGDVVGPSTRAKLNGLL
jgi:peptidoglycan hydrolase-like protein with peptidoglycan-binding domain